MSTIFRNLVFRPVLLIDLLHRFDSFLGTLYAISKQFNQIITRNYRNTSFALQIPCEIHRQIPFVPRHRLIRQWTADFLRRNHPNFLFLRQLPHFHQRHFHHPNRHNRQCHPLHHNANIRSIENLRITEFSMQNSSNKLTLKRFPQLFSRSLARATFNASISSSVSLLYSLAIE